MVIAKQQGLHYSSRDPESVSIMLYQLGSEPMEQRRAWNRVIMIYKIYHHIVEVPVHHLLHITNSRTHGSMANKICQISTRVDVYKYSFIPATITARNNIPATFRNLPSVDNFRHAIHTNSMCETLQHYTVTFNVFYLFLDVHEGFYLFTRESLEQQHSC